MAEWGLMDMARLTDGDLEALRGIEWSVFRSRVDAPTAALSQWMDYWGERVAYFSKEGLVREGTLEERLDVKYKLADLKLILGRFGLKHTGRKSDLIRLLVANVPASTVRGLVEDTMVYRLTPKGRQLVEQYEREKERARQEVEAEALALLMRGDVEAAGNRAAGYMQSRPYAKALAGIVWDWSKGPPRSSIEAAKYLVAHPYDDLPYGPEQRSEVGLQLALSAIVGEDIVRGTAPRLLRVTGGAFQCEPLETFLRTCADLSDFLRGKDPASAQDLATIYAHTRLFEARNEYELRRLLTLRFGRGIQVLTSRPEEGCCRTCATATCLFEWREVRSLPRLPRHWGCRCSYAGWFD